MSHQFNVLPLGKGGCNHHPMKPVFVPDGSFWKLLNSCRSTDFISSDGGGWRLEPRETHLPKGFLSATLDC